MKMRVSLSRLTYAGYWGASMLKGEEPYYVERQPNALDFEFRCYDESGDLRLRIQCGWVGNGWLYEPVPVRKNTKLPRPGDVVYLPDGGYQIAA